MWELFAPWQIGVGWQFCRGDTKLQRAYADHVERKHGPITVVQVVVTVSRKRWEGHRKGAYNRCKEQILVLGHPFCGV